MYFLGIDVSTTATKALLIDRAGQVVGRRHATEYAFETPQPAVERAGSRPVVGGSARQSSARCWRRPASTPAARSTAVGLTGQMHGLVLLDEAGQVLRPAILWNDQRTQAQCDEIHRRVGRETLDPDHRQRSR